MKGVHKPTALTIVIVVVVLFVAYHFLLGRKSKSK